MNLGRLICLFILLRSSAILAQTEVQGTLIDSAHRTLLQSATVSLYEQGDLKVNKVALSDRFGKFRIKDLPANKPLRLEFTFQGFEKIVREIQLGAKEVRDLGMINMSMRTDELNAVEILAPVRMNGDTIEFNADAFALDTNAVIEDLLHKLPGMVVWGDGMITYNGKEIPSVLVNGKPFFGSDKGIALQNIAKDAVKKMQVYDTRPEADKITDPNNPAYEMNVVLKEGREEMYFGNLTAAAGTEERYEGNMNMNLATTKTQSTLAYSANNTNKYLNSVEQLLKNTTFKGVGVNADFDSDFLRSGLLKQQVLGARFQYDFEGRGQVNRVNLTEGEILTRWDRTLIRDSSSTQLASGNTGTATRSNVSISNQELQSQYGSLRYQYTGKRNHRDWSWNSRFSVNQENREVASTINRANHYPDDPSRLESFLSSAHADKGMDFTTAVSIGESTRYDSVNRLPEQLSYDLELSSQLNQRRWESRNSSVFEQLLNEGTSRNVDRKYNRLQDERAHLLLAVVKYRSFEFSNRVKFYRADTDAEVVDRRDGSYSVNEVLSHISSFNQLSYHPSFRYRLLLHNRNLVGRVSERLQVYGELGYRLHHEENESTQAYLRLNHRYASPLPKAGLTYDFSRPGRFVADAALSYALDETYPTLQHLRPLYDDIDPSYRYVGGSDLRETSLQSLQATLNFRELKAHGWSSNLQANYHRYQNALSDSIHYSEGQQQVYTVNAEHPTQSIHAQTSVVRSFLLPGDRSLNFVMRASRGRDDRFQYVAGQGQKVQINTKSASMNAHFTRVNKMQVAWTSHWSTYDRVSPASPGSNYSSTSWNSGISMSYQVMPRWNVASNASIRLSKSTYHDAEAFVWNASSTYRLLKGNNLHLKVSAYDLLRQFEGVYQYHDYSEFTTGYRNNLTQYFMLSVSYFPRKFGR
jgi:hypothetical protein